jgi:putative drug exporter of the RND superfamily
VIATFLLLARALRSLWLPVKALLLNLLSLAAAFGVLTFVWQQGHGTTTLFASPATGAVTLWVPLAVFALLFGLSMDYEVFILTRITEEYEKPQTPARPSSGGSATPAAWSPPAP